MNKIEFINKLINNPKLSLNQKDRVYKLVKIELDNFELIEESILDEIKKIKEKVEYIEGTVKGAPQESKIEDPQKEENKSLPSYLNPNHLSSYLKEYNQNPILKYTCHVFDDSDQLKDLVVLTGKDKYSFKEHLKLIKSEYFNLNRRYEGTINQNIKGIIGNYLNGPNLKDEKQKDQGWSIDNIKLNWSSESIFKWCNEHPLQVPNPGENFNYFPYQFPSIELKSTGETIQYFSDLVIHFKKLFHIRNDNSFKIMVEMINREFFPDQSIVFQEFPDNIEFFTDIGKVRQAYKKIIEMCNRYALENKEEKPKIFLSLKEDHQKNKIIFSIHHINSQFGKTATNTKGRIGVKITDLIKNQINGVCDLFIRADFKNSEFAEINLWNAERCRIEYLRSFSGVEFILIF